MAFNPVKVPANIGTASANAGGNQGFQNLVYNFQYFEFGSGPTARAGAPIGQAPCQCTMIGVAAAMAIVGSAQTTFMPQSIRGIVGSAVQLCSSNPIIIGSGSLGPAWTATIAWQGQSAQSVAFLSSSAGGTVSSTQIQPAVLAAATSRQFGQGDVLAISTSGSLAVAANISCTLYLRDDNGAY